MRTAAFRVLAHSKPSTSCSSTFKAKFSPQVNTNSKRICWLIAAGVSSIIVLNIVANTVELATVASNFALVAEANSSVEFAAED